MQCRDGGVIREGSDNELVWALMKNLMTKQIPREMIYHTRRKDRPKLECKTLMQAFRLTKQNDWQSKYEQLKLVSLKPNNDFNLTILILNSYISF